MPEMALVSHPQLSSTAQQTSHWSDLPGSKKVATKTMNEKRLQMGELATVGKGDAQHCDGHCTA